MPNPAARARFLSPTGVLGSRSASIVACRTPGVCSACRASDFLAGLFGQS